MNKQQVIYYVFLFLGWPLFGKSHDLIKSRGKLDKITFEIDLANEIYLKIVEENNFCEYPYGFAYQQKYSYPSIYKATSSKDSLSSSMQMLSITEETEGGFYPATSSKLNPIKETLYLIDQILTSFEEDGTLVNLKKEWSLKD